MPKHLILIKMSCCKYFKVSTNFQLTISISNMKRKIKNYKQRWWTLLFSHKSSSVCARTLLCDSTHQMGKAAFPIKNISIIIISSFTLQSFFDGKVNCYKNIKITRPILDACCFHKLNLTFILN